MAVIFPTYGDVGDPLKEKIEKEKNPINKLFFHYTAITYILFW